MGKFTSAEQCCRLVVEARQSETKTEAGRSEANARPRPRPDQGLRQDLKFWVCKLENWVCKSNVLCTKYRPDG